MKKCFLLAILSFSGWHVQAQAPASGRVTGKLIENTSKEPLGFASVGLFSAKDSSLVKGGLSAESGKFELDNLQAGNYFLKVNLIGFAPKVIPNLTLSATNPQLHLGTITVASTAQKLSEIEIVAQKDLVEYGLDKQVVNVAKDISSTGGTASDALKNVPSIGVDAEGKVSVRGSSNLTVLVDGKNSGQDAQTILSQTPASAIEKIEVITNPSAKYDAQGMGGIINIILKKEKKPGLNGSVMANLGNNHNYNGSLGLNYSFKKWNFFGSYDFNRFSRNGYYQLKSYRNQTYLEQNQTGYRKGIFNTPKLGFDMQLSDKQAITFTVKSFFEDPLSTETVFNDVIAGAPSYFTRKGRTENEVFGTDVILNYRKTFETKGQELSAGVVYTHLIGRYDKFFEQQNTNADRAPYGNEFYEDFLQDFHVKPLVLVLDYVHPIGEKGKLETGLKHNQRVLTSEFRTEVAGPGRSNPTTVDSLSSKFAFGDYVSAAYASYANAWKKINYQVGLRAEQTNLNISDLNENDAYSTGYMNLFPSVFLSHELNENRKIQFSYSRRVNRPHYEAINPFVNYSDPNNIWSGNPKIKPEYIDSYEGTFVQFWNTGSLTSTAFFRNVHNLIQQVRYVKPEDPVKTRAYNTYVNLDEARSFGLEISGSQTLATWWKVNGNVSAFNYIITGNPLGVEANNNRFSWLSRLNSNFTLPKELSVQLSVNYRGPQALAQGTRGAVYNTDIALKKEVLQKKGSVTFRVSDIFNTLQYDTNVSSQDFSYDLTFKGQTRMAFLGFSYRFGNEQDKRRRQDSSGGMEGMF